jgi:YesN/AraC family two-component response regulator
VGVDIKHMLKNTNLSIKEITDELNFPNMSFFGKYCRNHFGISPSEYRKQLRERTDE